jgi:hypothetical protein
MAEAATARSPIHEAWSAAASGYPFVNDGPTPLRGKPCERGWKSRDKTPSREQTTVRYPFDP